MEFSIQETAEVVLAVMVFSLVLFGVFENYAILQQQLLTLIASWCSYGI